MEEGAFNGPKPIITNNPKDPRLRSYNDSLNSYNLAPAYNKQILNNLQKASTVKQGFQAILKTNEEFQKKGLNYQLGFNRKEFPRQKVSDGFVGAFSYDYKKPVQPVIYQKPKVKPIYTENPKDPRLGRYNGSLSLYNKTQDIKNPKYYEKGHDPSWYSWKGDINSLNRFMKKNKTDADYEYYSTGKFPGKIQPVKTGDFGEGMAYPIYKKPVQPIVYKKPEPVKVEEPVKEVVTPQVEVQTPAPVVETPVVKVEPTPTQPTSTKQKVPTIRSSNNYGDTGTVNYGSFKEIKTQMPKKKGPSQWKTTKSNFTMKDGGLLNAYKNAKHGAELYDPRTMEGHIVGMKQGGSPLNRPITCSSCGHSWTVSDSGPNPLSCHNCGGVAKMPNGGELKYIPASDNRVYSDNNRVVSPNPFSTTKPNIISLIPKTEESVSYGVLDQPQVKMMKAYSGKEQKPSEYLQNRTYDNSIANAFYKNKAVGVAADLVFDPLNILPTAALSKFKTLPGTVNKLNEVKRVYNTSKNVVQKTDNISDAVGILGMQRGGKVDHSNDDDMVNGVASILRRVKDKKNRLQLANQLSSQFNREKVKYNLNDFLNKSKVKK